MKVLLILVDGMRADAIANHPVAKKYMEKSFHTLSAKTVMPSLTLPCHMSLFHSVEPTRHGTTTNTYMPPAKPINGLFDRVRLFNKKSAFFYNWEQLRDLSKPGSLELSYYLHGATAVSNDKLTDEAINNIGQHDLTFLYLGHVDAAGHDFGWMSGEYMDSIDKSWANIDRIVSQLPQDYVVVITADHGGHDRTHGTEMAEDMTIPLMIMGNNIEAGVIENASIMDIAPTIVKLMGIPADEEWEGKSLI
ncbi:MAG: alkaline phosphatase family protein [Clostridia bacterium]|nr:alkaline phosphatase family protein [Clostridia bacterium]